MKYRNIIGYGLIALSLVGFIFAIYSLGDMNDYWSWPEVGFPQKYVEVSIALFLMLIGVLMLWRANRR